MRRCSDGRRTLERELESVKFDDLTRLNDGRCNQPHPSALFSRRLNLDVDCESAFMLDRVGAKRFHRSARILTIMCNGGIPSNFDSAGQAE